MSSVVLYDSSVLINHIRTGQYLDRIFSSEGMVRNSSVVLAELLRGATSKADREIVRWLEQNFPILTPTAKNWLESGEILAQMKTDRGFETHKLRDLHFDVLIALTARSHGARLITSNRTDFELIRSYRDFKLEVW
jgi:predicted nucleic acid-binding protein